MTTFSVHFGTTFFKFYFNKLGTNWTTPKKLTIMEHYDI